jgi:hypothetical protein
MKLIEPPSKVIEKDAFEKSIDQIKQLFQSGSADEAAENALIARFVKGLDNRFVMLHKIQLEKDGGVFPPILIGPAGLIILYVSHAKGFFRAKDESWWEMNKSTQKYGPARPNLIKQTKDYAQKLAAILEANGKSHPEILPMLIFANPGANVETSNPGVRIVRMDGIESLIDTLLRSEDVLKPTEITYLADGLEIMANPEKAIPLGEGEDFFGRDLLLPEKKSRFKLADLSLPNELVMPPVEQRLKFSQKQWAILVVMLVLTIVILIVAIMYALSIF